MNSSQAFDTLYNTRDNYSAPVVMSWAILSFKNQEPDASVDHVVSFAMDIVNAIVYTMHNARAVRFIKQEYQDNLDYN